MSSSEDVRAAFPSGVQKAADTDAPVREGIVAAQYAVQLAHQDLSAYAAAQADVTRATGIYLQGLGKDRGVFKIVGEDDEVFRARALSTPAVVTRENIVAAASLVLAPHTSILPQCFESILDRWFVWRDQVDPRAVHSFIGANPDYTTRYYSERTQANPGGAWAFRDMVGRFFVLRVPILSAPSRTRMFVYSGAATIPVYRPAAFINDGSNVNNSELNGTVATFVGTGQSEALNVYAAIVNAVNNIKGQAVRWMMVSDSGLT